VHQEGRGSMWGSTLFSSCFAGVNCLRTLRAPINQSHVIAHQFQFLLNECMQILPETPRITMSYKEITHSLGRNH